MHKFNKCIRQLHKITGLTIAVFYIMWFVTGVVLLYHGYPRVSAVDRYRHMATLSAEDLPGIYDVPGITDTASLRTLTVRKDLGKTVWSISGLSTLPSASDLDSIALEWAGGGAIAKVDTLKKRQQWVMYERYEKSLPILRYYIDNKDKTEVFISRKSGEVLQTTTRFERIWSWCGAIPHKFYLPFLRKDVKRWENVLLIGGLFCLAAALTGFYMGVYYMVVSYRKRNKVASPFRKKVWKYHHIGGLIFGIFLISWGISGSLAMQRVPKWMVNYDGDYFVSTSKLRGKTPLPLDAYKLDYRSLFSKYDDIKSISWEYFGNVPIYVVVSGTEEVYVDASDPTEVRPLNLSQADIEAAVERYFGKDVSYKMTLIDEYDEYYLSEPGRYPLPVWKVEIDNPDGSRLYISPSDCYVKYLNHNRMAKKWLFSATHYLGIKYFVLHNVLRLVCLWILSAGCVFVCVTGIGIYLSKMRKRPVKRSDTQD